MHLYSYVVLSHIDPGIGLVTCFGQWDISKHHTSRGMISPGIWGLPCWKGATSIKESLVWPPGGWKITGRGKERPNHFLESIHHLTHQLDVTVWGQASPAEDLTKQHTEIWEINSCLKPPTSGVVCYLAIGNQYSLLLIILNAAIMWFFL